MSRVRDRLLSESHRLGSSRFRPWVYILVPITAILFQVYVPRFFQYLSYLELPLLATVYFALVLRAPLTGMFLGAAIGLMQDSLSGQPLGMFGIVKTLVGYFTGTVSARFDVENPVIRLVLAFFFFFFHQFFYWVLGQALMGQTGPFNLGLNFISGVLNAIVTIPLFHVFDKLKETT